MLDGGDLLVLGSRERAVVAVRRVRAPDEQLGSPRSPMSMPAAPWSSTDREELSGSLYMYRSKSTPGSSKTTWRART
jgi:hypothetical protein